LTAVDLSNMNTFNYMPVGCYAASSNIHWLSMYRSEIDLRNVLRSIVFP